jgi:hypothetical protein
MSPITYQQDLAGVDWAEMKATLQRDNFDNGRSPEQLKASFENSAVACIAYAEGCIIGTCGRCRTGCAMPTWWTCGR